MRTHFHLRSCIAVLAMLAAVPAWGQFSYVSDFNSVTPGTKPPGWVTQNSVAPSIDPQIMDQDPPSWYHQSACYTNTPWSVYFGDDMAGMQDYSVSGGRRLNLIHTAQYAGGVGASAWYAGPAADYPMSLQQQSLKAEFDVFLRTGSTGLQLAGDGLVFAVQPVVDQADAESAARNRGGGGGMLGWQSGGFAIEFDDFPTGGDPSITGCNEVHGAPLYNHIGLDLYSFWGATTTGLLTSMQTLYDVVTGPPYYWPCAADPDVIPDLKMVGNGNWPVHITVYYNDPAHGGLGQVQAYMRIPDTTPGPLAAWSCVGGFGVSEGDPPEGRKILDYQVGPWPTSGAIFGFTAGTGWATGILQVANVQVATAAVSGTADPFTPAIPQLDPGSTVELTATPTSGTPSQPGWNVRTSRSLVQLPSTYFLGRDLATDLAAGVSLHLLPIADVTGEPSIDYVDTGGNGNLAAGRPFPGLTPVNDNFIMVAKGWIQFPEAGDYALGVGADDEVEVTIGGQVIAELSGFTGMAPDAERRCNLHVPSAGFYPITLRYLAAADGDGVEFYRRLTDITNPMTYPYVPIGSSDRGLAHQPVVYGLLDGNPAPEPPNPSGQPWTITLSKTERVDGGTVAGATGFKIKTTPSPWIYYQPGPGYNLYWKRDRQCEDWNTVALMFLDFLGNDPAHAGTSDTINFANGDTTGWPRVFTGGNPFPNAPGDAQMFALRAEGFVELAPGTYFLGLDANDQARLFIGDQAIDVVYYQPHIMLFKLVVPPDAGGTYPIRVEYTQYADVGYVDLYQVVDGNVVPVNGPGSTIAVHQSVTPGATYHVNKTNGYVIPASAKRADPGQGGTLGWNATFVACAPEIPWFGYAEGALNYNIGDRPNGLLINVPDTSQHPTVVAYGASQGLGHFPGSQTDWKTAFPSCSADYDDFIVAVEGLIEFPAPGDYGLNTCASGACKMWIGGQLVQSHSVLNAFPWQNGDVAQDNIPASVHVEQAGIYDIRVAYQQCTLQPPTPLLEVFQYQTADASAVLLNTPDALSVYQGLASGGAPNNPIVLPAGTKTAPYDAGITPGLHAEVVSWAAASGDTYGQSVYGGLGHDAFMNLHQAADLLDAVAAGDAEALLRQQGTVVFSGTVPVVDFGTDGWALGAGEPFPGGVSNWFAVRLTGRVALKQGGTVICPFGGDAVKVTIGGVDMHREGAIYESAEFPMLYVYASEDGLYPIQIDYMAKGGNSFLWLTTVDAGWVNFIPVDSTVPNYFGVQFFAETASCTHRPFADADGDGDVDQVDFGALQLCYTGPSPSAPPTGACKCFDRDNYGAGNGAIDGLDLMEFEKCFTGPAVQVLPAICNP